MSSRGTEEEIKRLQAGESFTQVFPKDTIRRITGITPSLAGIGIGGLVIVGIILFLVFRK